MDKRFLLALVLCFAFVVLWLQVISPALFPKPAAPPEPQAPATQPVEGRTDTAPAAARAATRPVLDPKQVETVVLENDAVRLTFSSGGAVMTKAELLKGFMREPEKPDPLNLLRHYDDLPQGLELRDLGDPDSHLERRVWRVERNEAERTVTFVMEPGVGGFQGPYRVTKQITLPASGAHADVTLTFDYLGSGSIEKHVRLTPSGGVSMDSDVYGTHDLTGAESLVFQKDPQEGDRIAKVAPLEMAKIEPKAGEEPRKPMAFNGDRRFVADLNSYFGVYCALTDMPKRMEAAFVGNIDPASSVKRASRTRVDLDFRVTPESGKPARHSLLMYFGPREERYVSDDLRAAHPDWASEFARVHKDALGMFSWIGNAVLALLRLLHGVVGNWGWAIVLLTCVVRLVLFPINRRSQAAMVRHSEAMSKIKPKLDALKEKYKNDARKFLQEQQALMKAEKISLVPLGGCLPILLQIPIFYGLFAALRSAIELRQAPFLWVKDLSQPDHLVRFAQPYPNPLAGFCCCAPPGMSDTISGLNLLPILMTVAWFFNQLLMPRPANEDPQLKQQRKMMMFLPLMFGFMMYGYGAGLSLYWLTSSLLGIVESRVIKKWLDKRKKMAAVA